jgi:hypothetical protein
MADYLDLRQLDESFAIGTAFEQRLRNLRYGNLPNDYLKKCFVTWAEPEDVREYPTVAIIIREGKYEAHSLSSTLLDETYNPTAGTVLVQDAEFVTDVELHIVCNDPIQRSRVIRSIREALQEQEIWKKEIANLYLPVRTYQKNPVELSLLVTELRLIDTETEDMRRERKAILVVHTRMPVLREVQITELQPRVPDFDIS